MKKPRPTYKVNARGICFIWSRSFSPLGTRRTRARWTGVRFRGEGPVIPELMEYSQENPAALTNLVAQAIARGIEQFHRRRRLAALIRSGAHVPGYPPGGHYRFSNKGEEL